MLFRGQLLRVVKTLFHDGTSVAVAYTISNFKKALVLFFHLLTSIESHGVCYYIGVIFVEGVFLNLVIELAIVATVTASDIIGGFLPHMGAF